MRVAESPRALLPGVGVELRITVDSELIPYSVSASALT